MWQLQVLDENGIEVIEEKAKINSYRLSSVGKNKYKVEFFGNGFEKTVQTVKGVVVESDFCVFKTRKRSYLLYRLSV